MPYLWATRLNYLKARDNFPYRPENVLTSNWKHLQEAHRPLGGSDWYPLESCPHDSLQKVRGEVGWLTLAVNPKG